MTKLFFFLSSYLFLMVNKGDKVGNLALSYRRFLFNKGDMFKIEGKNEKGDVVIQKMSLAAEKKKKMALPLNAAKDFSVYEKKEIRLAKNDSIRITENSRSMEGKRLDSGNNLKVKGFTKGGDILATTGKRDMVLSKDFGHFKHGYYTTSPASQGKSVNRVIVMQSSLSGKAASKEQFYVSATRGKFSISVHTDDKNNLMRSVGRSTQRMTAHDVVEGKKPSSKVKDIKEKFKKFGSIYRAVKSKVANFGKNAKKENPVLNIKPLPTKKKTNAAPAKIR